MKLYLQLKESGSKFKLYDELYEDYVYKSCDTTDTKYYNNITLY